jgi:hypothetical protein
MSTTKVVMAPHTIPKTPLATAEEPISTSICRAMQITHTIVSGAK